MRDRIEHPLGMAFSDLTTPLNTEELALYVNLPQREVPGIPVTVTTDFSLNVPRANKDDIILGKLLDGGEETDLDYPIPLQSLKKHTLVTGITGSGKSTTCRRILTELHQRRIPFLVIEPAKNEYVEWAIALNSRLAKNDPQRVSIYMPGAREFRDGTPLKSLSLNPLDIVWLKGERSPKILSHIDRIKSILNAAFPMQESLPILLEEILFAVYGQMGWLGETPAASSHARPTLRDMFDAVGQVVKQKGYEERVTANLTAALRTRLQSLRRGWKEELFDQPRSTPWPDLFDRPVVVNFSLLTDESDRAFAMAMLLQFLFEYRQAQFETDEARRNPVIHHLTMVEEAHRVLPRAQAVTAEQANPQGKVGEMFSIRRMPINRQ